MSYVLLLLFQLVAKHKDHFEPLELDSYNPQSGTAYYFNKDGKPLRKMPSYVIAGSTANHDDKPEQSDCTKAYPKVSQSGWTHLFLWFCPIHGHCYGFHMINGSEGQKDPFFSASKYLQTAPQELFYDFSCSLSEYTLNREPKFWRNTRFWHDVFHSYTHKCGANYCSRLCILLIIFHFYLAR